MKSSLTHLPVVALLLLLPFAKFYGTTPSPDFAGQLLTWDSYEEMMSAVGNPLVTSPMLQDSAVAKKMLIGDH